MDADACPNVVKEILFRAAERTRVLVTLIANQPIRAPRSSVIRAIQVPQGFDAADRWIETHVENGDLVVTADIPLAASVIEKGALALNPRGELYTDNNIRERLSTRNLMDELRGAGVVTGGPATLSQRDRQAFGNQLDSLLAKRISVHAAE